MLATAGLAALVLAPAAPVLAQQAPNAGTLLRQQPAPTPPRGPSETPVAPQAPAAPAAEAGPAILVKGIRVTGAHLIPAEELTAQLQPLVGKQHTFADLRRAAVALIGYYAEKGYVARVFLPPQEIKDGVVEYQVVEGARGAVTVQNQGKRIDAARVQRFIDARLPQGAPMDLNALGDAVNILNQQPGVQATAVLGAGKAERDVDVLVAAQDRPLLSYTFGVNNQGSEGTGVVQGSAGMVVANPTGRFDSASLLLNAAQGSIYGRADYSIAVGDRGLRLGVDGSGLGYKLVQSSLSSLHASGSAVTGGLTASYPIALRKAFSLGLTGSVDGQQFIDRTIVGETGNRTIEVGSFGVNGSRLQFGGPFAGLQAFGATVVAGNADQHNAQALAVDKISAKTEGTFVKLAWNLGWTRPLAWGWTFNGLAHGQFADKNLDSSEKFFLGGPTGVRGYPTAEASGDDGWVASANFIHPIADRWTVTGFFDGGGITVDHTPFRGGAAHNRYTLASAGASLDWRLTSNVVFDATVAAPVGDNPGAQPNGTNSDGSKRTARVWVSLNAAF